MITKTYLIAAAASVSLAACAAVPAPPAEIAHADLVTADGKSAGRAYLTANGDSVTLNVRAKGLTPGEHGIHLHAIGKCDAPAFTTAGGHLNPGMKMHGTMNPAGAHMGDMPNLSIQNSGDGAATVSLPGTTHEAEPVIFDADGTAIVIHVGPDDYKTDPSGNSGGRIACGIFVRG